MTERRIITTRQAARLLGCRFQDVEDLCPERLRSPNGSISYLEDYVLERKRQLELYAQKPAAPRPTVTPLWRPVLGPSLCSVPMCRERAIRDGKIHWETEVQYGLKSSSKWFARCMNHKQAVDAMILEDFENRLDALEREQKAAPDVAQL